MSQELIGPNLTKVCLVTGLYLKDVAGVALANHSTCIPVRVSNGEQNAFAVVKLSGIESFVKTCSLQCLTVHEIIPDGQPMRLFADVDLTCDSEGEYTETRSKIISRLKSVHHENEPLGVNIYETVYPGSHKISIHAIYPTVNFTRSAGSASAVSKYLTPETTEWIDRQVYRKNTSLRMLWSAKNRNVKKPVHIDYPGYEYSLINAITPGDHVVTIDSTLESQMGECTTIDEREFKCIMSSIKKLGYAGKLVPRSATRFDDKCYVQLGNLCGYSCEVCGHVHMNENPYLTIYKTLTYFNCRRSTTPRTVDNLILFNNVICDPANIPIELTDYSGDLTDVLDGPNDISDRPRDVSGHPMDVLANYVAPEVSRRTRGVTWSDPEGTMTDKNLVFKLIESNYPADGFSIIPSSYNRSDNYIICDVFADEAYYCKKCRKHHHNVLAKVKISRKTKTGAFYCNESKSAVVLQ